jgi:hypothetical protein
VQEVAFWHFQGEDGKSAICANGTMFVYMKSNLGLFKPDLEKTCRKRISLAGGWR